MLLAPLKLVLHPAYPYRVFCITGTVPCRRFCWNKYDDEWVVTTSSEPDPQYHAVAAIQASATGALPSGATEDTTWAVLRCNEHVLLHDWEIAFAEHGNLDIHKLTLVRGAEAVAEDQRQTVMPSVRKVRCCNVTVTLH